MCLKRVFGTATFRNLDEEDDLTKPPAQPDPRKGGGSLPYASGKYAPPPAHTAAVPDPPPKPPRPISPAVRRRSWMEPMVRFWWAATLVQLVIGSWFLADQVKDYLREKRLIQYGMPLTATIVAGGDEHDSRSSRSFPPDQPCDIQFIWNGQTIALSSVALSSLGDTDFFHPGETIPVRVDPTDPSVWTDRTQPELLGRRLIAGIVMVPTIAATLLASLMLNRRVLRVWRDAEAVEYAVVGSTRSALAPLSHTVRCEPVDLRMDRRLVTVYLPGRFAKPAAGEILWLMHPPGKVKSSIAAAAYE